MALLIFLLKWAHILTGIGMIVGIVGREAFRMLARRAMDVQSVADWLRRSDPFERVLLIPCSQLVLLAGITLAWLEGWPLFGFLQGASANWLLAALVLFLSMIPIIVWVFLPRGKVFAQRLDAALALGQVTPELQSSFHDPVVRAAHVFEVVVMAAIIYLMIYKPF